MIVVDGERLTVPQIALVADRADAVSLDAGARARAARSHEYAEQVSAQRPVYGRSTGVGANRAVGVDDPAAAAVGLLRSHATAAGPSRETDRVRSMLVVRLNQLAAGGSGASPVVLDGLAAMLAADALPPVREYGSIGTGDLPALAVTALALMGELPTVPALPPVRFGAQDALAFLSSNAAAIGDAALAQDRLAALARSALRVASLTFTAVGGNPEAFAEVVERVTPFEGTRVVCEAMRELVAPAGPAAGAPSRIQDPFGLRVLPQVHGAYLDALARLEETVVRYANAPSENPVLLPDAGVAHHGGFHAPHLAQAVDAVRSAAAQSAQLSLARLAMLIEPGTTGLAPFLGDGTPAASGVMVCEYVAASALGDLRALGAPMGLQSVTISRGVEEDASFASLGARQALDAVAPYRTVLACELVAAVRALRQRGAEPPEPFAALPGEMTDRDLTPDLDQAAALLTAS